MSLDRLFVSLAFAPDGRVPVGMLSQSGRDSLFSAAGLLHADFRVAGDEYAVLFRLAAALLRDAAARRELFLRACLNVLLHNRDDHLKNASFLMDAAGRWSLAPFYDFTFSDGPGGWQTLSVAGEGANPGPADLLRLAAEVDLPPADARDALDRALDVRSRLPALCRDIGVKPPRLPPLP